MKLFTALYKNKKKESRRGPLRPAMFKYYTDSIGKIWI